MFTNVLPCNCKHEAQDKMYGPGKRLHNLKATGAACTACGDKKTSGGYKKSDAGDSKGKK